VNHRIPPLDLPKGTDRVIVHRWGDRARLSCYDADDERLDGAEYHNVDGACAMLTAAGFKRIATIPAEYALPRGA